MKIKNKLLRVLSLVLIITMLLPSNVYADKVNGGGSDSSGGIGSGSDKGDNPSSSKTGWLVYLAKKQPMVGDKRKEGLATLESPVVFVSAGAKIPDDYNTSGLKARLAPSKKVTFTDEKGNYYTYAKWGRPFDADGNARGDDIRKLFEDDKNDFSKNPDQSDMEWVIINYLGKSAYNKMNENPNDYYLVLEACAWYTGRDGKGKYANIAASTYGWATIFNNWGKTPVKGDGRDWCALYRLPRSCYLSGDWPSLPKKPTDLGPSHWGGSGDGISYKKILDTKNTDGLGYGYGMMVIKTNLQTTCNETVTVPHHPAGEANGEYSIVKTYVKHHSDGTYEFEKCTSKINSFQTVKVEGEKATTKKPSYRLVHYIVTTKNNYKKETDNEKNYPQDLLPESKTIDSKGKLIWSDSVEKTGTKVTIKDGKGNKLTNKVTYNSDEEVKSATINIKNLCKNADHGTVYLLLIADEDAQTTCNEKLTVPHQPPDESKGTYTIIKNYVDKKGDTYKSKKCTSKTNSSPIIKVEPEEKTTGYKLVAYAATTKSYKDKDSEKEHNPLNLLAAVNDEGELVWENAVKNELGTNKMFKGSQKNTTELKGGTFNLTKDKLKGAKTVYLLLIKEDEDIQTTCDEDIPTPHKAPNESKGTYKIVKNYVTKTDDTYTDDGCYSKTNVANKIKIEDEAKTTGYHLEAWKVSTNTKSPVTSVKDKKLVWEKNVPPTVKKSGTTPKTVDLKEKGNEGNTVYLLLVRDKSKVQTTCDEPIPTPHPAPNESTGTYKIVKNYVTDSNGKYKDDGCFCKTKVTHQIKIEDESTTTGYTLPY